MADTRKEKSGKREVVRFNLYLPQDAYEALEKLRKLSGKRSLAETVRAALKLYLIAEQGREEGKDIVLVDRKTKEKERLVPI